MGKRWRVVHPDGVAEIGSGGATRWMFFEIDRGTAELQRSRLKLRRYARFFLSGTWRARFARFPQVRIVTAHRPRVRRMLAVMEDALQVFSGRERDARAAGLVVAVAWEHAFLADPAAVAGRRACLGRSTLGPDREPGGPGTRDMGLHAGPVGSTRRHGRPG